MSQRARVLWVIALAALPLVAFGGFTVWRELEEERAQVAAQRVLLAQAVALAAEAFVDGHLSTVRSVAAHRSFARPHENPELAADVRRIAEANPEWEGLGIVGADGYSLAGSLGVPRVFIGDRPYFRQALASGRPVVSSALIGRVSGKATMVLAVPLAGGAGVLVAPLPTDRFGASLLGKVGSPSIRVIVIDPERQTFIHPDAVRVRALARVHGTPDADAALAGQAGSLVRDEGGAQSLVAYAPVAKYGWGVLLLEPTASAFATAYYRAIERAALLALIVAAVAGLGWFLGGRLSLLFQRAVDARQEAERLSQDLKRAVATRDEFLAAASHDLRNPLATVFAAADTLKRLLEPAGGIAGERLNGCVEHIRAASRRMASLIDGFLDLARLQMGRSLELEMRETDLVPLTREVVEESRQTSERHHIVFEAPAQMPARVDAARWQRVVGNLLGNAIKYSPDGGDIRVRLARAEGDAHVVLTVRDHGIGIPPGDLERIFERFERGTNVAGRIAGTGIGLAGARQVIGHHGGSISVQSTPGAGAMFTVRLPADGMPEAQAGRAEAGA